jgi:hypothetical protein
MEEVGVPFAVFLKCAVGRVERVAVELCNELARAPHEVDFMARDPLIDLRGRKPVALDEPEEVVFERRAGGVGGGRVERES